MNTAAKGRRLERKTQDLFEALGYETMTSRASKGVFDVHAWNGIEGVYCQVKSNSWPGAVEMERLKEMVVPPGCRKLVHRWRDHQRLPDTKEIR